METLLHVAKTMEDKATIGLLEVRKGKLMRALRRGNEEDASAAARFLKAQKEEIVRERAEAAVVDAEAKMLKAREKAKKDATLALTMSKKKKVPLPLPALEEGAVADPYAVELRDGVRDESADVVAPKAGVDVVAPPPPVAVALPRAKGLAPLPPGSSVFAVEVDTAARLENTLGRLAVDWVHDNKKPALRWLSQQIMAESTKYRKGLLIPKFSKYFSNTTTFPSCKAKGHLELYVVRRILKMSVDERRSFFERQLNVMLKLDAAVSRSV